MTYLFDCIFFIFSLLYSPFFLKRLREAEDKQRLWRERTGCLSAELVDTVRGKKVIWLHAVSVGEVMAARPLVEKLRAMPGGYQLVISTVTPTGQAMARKVFSGLPVFYFPFDYSWTVKKVLHVLRPELILLMETEIWPNLVLEAARRGIQTGVVNGRLSVRSFANYSRIAFLIKPVFEKISFYLVQFSADKERFQKLAGNNALVHVTGNMKFDILPAALNSWTHGQQLIWQQNYRIWVAASTHPGEEVLALETYACLKKEIKNLRLIIVPRHVHRSAAIASAARGMGIKCAQDSAGAPAAELPEVLIVDRFGELLNWYSIAHAIFLGGSFAKVGGHNPIEAAVFQKPVITGPHLFNFTAVFEKFFAANAAVQARTADELRDSTRGMLMSGLRLEEMGKRAWEVTQELRGAAEKNADFIKRVALRI